MPTATCPIPVHVSSQVRRAQRARSYEGRGSPAKPSAARRSWPRWSSTRLLDHLVRAQQHGLRNRQAERLGGLEIHDQWSCPGLVEGELLSRILTAATPRGIGR